MPQEFDPSEFQYWAGCGEFEDVLILPQRTLERDGLVYSKLRDFHGACRGQYQFWYLYHASFKAIISDLRELGYTHSEGILQELSPYYPDFVSYIRTEFKPLA